MNILFIYKNYRQELWDENLNRIENLLADKGVYKIDCYLKSWMDKSDIKLYGYGAKENGGHN